MKRPRPSDDPGVTAEDARRTSLIIADSSELDNLGQVEQNSSAKKSSGLKSIAKQVIDIIKTRPFMSYPQVATIVVQLNLKNLGSQMDSEGLCSQSN